jgi:TolB-like protein
MKARSTCMFTGLFIVLMAVSLRAQVQPASKPSTRLTVAILDFDTSGTNTPEMGKQIAEALMATLSSEDGFTLVDRSSMAHTLQEHELSLTGLAKPEDAVRIGQLVGAKLLITGKAFTLDKNIYVTAKIIGTETTLVDGVLVKDKQDADVGTLVSQLSSKLADRIRTKGPDLIAATEPADPMPALKAKLAKRKLPKLVLNLTETHYGEPRSHPIDPAVQTEMESVLKQLGFEIADGNNANLADQGVDQVLKGEAFSEFGAHVENLVSCSARAEIKLTDRKTGDVLFSDRVTTRAADLSENIAAKTSLQKAGHELALRLADYYADQPATQKIKK